MLTAPGCGRAWSAALLREWQLAHLTDTARVLVSELLTNAVRASAGELDHPVQLSLASNGKRLLILVRDFNPGAPMPRHASSDDESGRGLMVVAAISDRFGWYWPEDGTRGQNGLGHRRPAGRWRRRARLAIFQRRAVVLGQGAEEAALGLPGRRGACGSSSMICRLAMV